MCFSIQNTLGSSASYGYRDPSTEQEKESSFDVIRKKWAVKVGDLQTTRETHASTSASEDLPTASDDLHIRQQGWALKATKKSTRFQEKVKDFLTD